MSCLPHPSGLLPLLPLPRTQSSLSWEFARLWPSLQTTSVPFYSAQSALYVEHKRLWLSPVSASDPHAECACGLVLPRTTPTPTPAQVNCTFAGQSRSVCPHHLYWISRGGCWQLLGVFHCFELRQMQCESGLHRPDVTGLFKTLWRSSVSYTLRFWAAQPAIQPTHSKLKFTGPKAPGAATRGWFICVCVCPWAFTWASVCLCVCVGGSRALGTESGSLLTATVAATLATQEGRCVEWVSGRGTYSRCLCVARMWLCLNI